MSQRTTDVALTLPEIDHLWELLAANEQEGGYYGNKRQYHARHDRIMSKLYAAEQELEERP